MDISHHRQHLVGGRWLASNPSYSGGGGGGCRSRSMRVGGWTAVAATAAVNMPILVLLPVVVVLRTSVAARHAPRRMIGAGVCVCARARVVVDE